MKVSDVILSAKSCECGLRLGAGHGRRRAALRYAARQIPRASVRPICLACSSSCVRPFAHSLDGTAEQPAQKLAYDQITPVCQRVGKVGSRALAVDWAWRDFRLKISQISFLTFATPHHKCRETFYLSVWTQAYPTQSNTVLICLPAPLRVPRGRQSKQAHPTGARSLKLSIRAARM